MADSDNGSIRIRRRDGSDTERKLVDGAQPNLSRDGRWLLLTRVSEDGCDAVLEPAEED